MRYYEDVTVGEDVPPVVQKLTVPVMLRWVACTETIRRDHYDTAFAIAHDGLPGPVISGSFCHSYLWQLVFSWAGPGGWVARLAHINRAMVHPGTALTFFGRVTKKEQVGDVGYVELEVGLRTDDGEVPVPGSATVALPLREGPAIPYPFNRPQ